MGSRPVVLVVKLAITAAVVGWVIHLVPLAAIGASLAQADLVWVAGAVVLQLASRLVAAGRLQLLGDALGLGLTFTTLLRTLLASGFYAVLLPGAAVAGAATWLKSVQHGADKAAALVAIVAARIVGLATLTATGALAWVLATGPEPWLGTLLVVVAPTLVAAVFALLFARPSRLASGLLASGWLGIERWMRSRPGGSAMAATLQRTGRLRAMPRRRVAAVLALSIAHDLLTSAVLWTCALAVGAELPFVGAVWIRAGLELLILLPISFAGVGVREITLITLGAAYGVTPADAVAWSLVLLFGTLLAALAGGVVELQALWRRRTTVDAVPAPPPAASPLPARTAGPTSSSACVINYNGLDHLPETLAALQAQSWRFDEILIVDDRSGDASVDLARRLCPHARILELERNGGPAAARNAGFAAARGDRVLFLDNDVRLATDTMALLDATLDADPGALVATPRVVYAHDPQLIQFESADCHYSGMMVPRCADRPCHEGSRSRAPTGSMITACFLIDRRRWSGGPLFDEDFGFNLEDHDFGLRARLRGHALWVDPRAVVHHGTGTAGLSHRPGRAVPEARLFYLVRNRWFVLAKCFSRGTLLLLAPALILVEVAQAAALTVAGLNRPWRRALVSLLRDRASLTAKRRAVQASRRIRDRAFLIGGWTTVEGLDHGAPLGGDPGPPVGGSDAGELGPGAALAVTSPAMPFGTPSRRVLLIGLDAAEWGRVRALAASGRMPALAELMRRGRGGTLRSPADRFAGAVWPCFYLGRPVPAHGIYHSKLWQQDAMRIEVPDERRLGTRPFWEAIGEAGRRVCLVDVPMVLGRPRPLEGVYVGGWGTHDLIATGSWPPALWRDLVARHGAPAMPAERFGLQTATLLTTLSDQLVRATAQVGAVARDLLARERWDLACVVLGATHRGGHYLWDLSQVDADGLPDDRRAALGSALDDVYTAVDREVAALLETVAEDTVVIVFAVNGMAPNPCWSDLLPALLERLDEVEHGRPPKRGLLFRIRQRVPMHVAGEVLRRLPVAVTQKLVPLWSARMRDWTSTRSFPLPMDHAGYLRINLQGREAQGIVPPGEAYRAELDRLRARLSGLRDARTGAPLVAGLIEAWAEAAPSDPGRDLLPDLVVVWGETLAREVREVRCDAVPGFSYVVPELLPSGRAGNHTATGWMVAVGPDVEPGPIGPDHAIEDLAPTCRALLGLPSDPALSGRPIAAVASLDAT